MTKILLYLTLRLLLQFSPKCKIHIFRAQTLNFFTETHGNLLHNKVELLNMGDSWEPAIASNLEADYLYR